MNSNRHFLLRQGNVLASISPYVISRSQICMSDTDLTPLSNLNTEVEACLSQLLHDFRNQLGGVKLYAAFLKKSLANDTLKTSEGIEVCDKILQQIDALTAQAKELSRSLKAPVKN